eukprot:scaffold8338_cov76-Alexandrium_tamarense.AAC.1
MVGGCCEPLPVVLEAVVWRSAHVDDILSDAKLRELVLGLVKQTTSPCENCLRSSSRNEDSNFKLRILNPQSSILKLNPQSSSLRIED